MYDFIIIGAGPAGLTAGLYAARSGNTVLILEEKNYGGQIINASHIENYPALLHVSGIEFAQNLYQQVKEQGAYIKYETVLSIEDEKIITNKNTYQAKNIIIANGLKHKKMNLNEEKYIGKGVSYCAVCDGAFYKNKIVAVVGGGNTALEDALYLSNIAEKVYIIHRRDTFKGEYKYTKEIKKKNNIEIILNTTIKKISGDETIEKIELENKKTLTIDGLFIAIGQIPDNKKFANVVELDENGYIKTNNEVCTKTKGIYAIGDTRVKKLRQLVTATSDGALAVSIANKNM